MKWKICIRREECVEDHSVDGENGPMLIALAVEPSTVFEHVLHILCGFRSSHALRVRSSDVAIRKSEAGEKIKIPYRINVYEIKENIQLYMFCLKYTNVNILSDFSYFRR